MVLELCGTVASARLLGFLLFSYKVVLPDNWLLNEFIYGHYLMRNIKASVFVLYIYVSKKEVV